MSNNHVQDLLDLCAEQGFRFDYVNGRAAVRVYPKNTGKPAVLYFAAKDPQAQMNQTADVRRLGVKLPGDEERQRAKLKREQEKMKILPGDGNKLASGQLDIPPQQSAHALDPFAAIKSRLDEIVNLVSEVEALVSTVEKDQEKMQQLKALMRSL